MQTLHNNLSVYTDGASRGNPGKASIAFIIYDQNNQIIHSYTTCLGIATNNFAEYTALLRACQWLSSNTSQATVNFFADSELMVKQLTGIYKIKDANISNLAIQIKQLLPNFISYSFTHIPRAQNKEADLLCNQTLDSTPNH